MRSKGRQRGEGETMRRRGAMKRMGTQPNIQNPAWHSGNYFVAKVNPFVASLSLFFLSLPVVAQTPSNVATLN